MKLSLKIISTIIIILFLVIALFHKQTENSINSFLIDYSYEVEDIIKQKGCGLFTLNSILNFYNKKNNINSLFNSLNIDKSFFSGVLNKDLKFIVESKYKSELNFYNIPSNIKIIDLFLKKRIPILIATNNNKMAFSSLHSIICFKKEKDLYHIYDPKKRYENKDSNFYTKINKDQLIEYLNVYAPGIIVNKNIKIPNDIVKYSKIFYEFENNLKSKEIKKSIIVDKMPKDVIYTILFYKNESDVKKNINLYNNYLKEQPNYVTNLDILLFDLFIKKNYFKNAFKIGTKIFKKDFDIHHYFNNRIRTKFFLYVFLCSYFENKSNFKEGFNNFIYSRLFLEKKLQNNKRAYLSLYNKFEDDWFYPLLEYLDIKNNSFKKYNTLDEFVKEINKFQSENIDFLDFKKGLMDFIK